MIQLKTPTNEQFTEAIQQVQAFVQAYDPQLQTRKGSVIRELLVRPCAYVYAGIKNALNSFVDSTAISTLIQSQATQDQLADKIASNYFATRIQGKKAKGVITLTMTTATQRISPNTVFYIDSSPFSTQKTILISSTQISGDDSIEYIAPRLLSSGLYTANIPVVAQNQGYIELAVDSTVQTSASLPGVESLQLTSPITGGGTTQTNAQLFTRIQSDYTASSDSAYALSRLLKDGPVQVIASNALASDSPSIFSVRNNNLQLSVGGTTQIFVKTQNQLSQTSVECTSTVQSTTHSLVIDNNYPGVSGALRVNSVSLQDGTSIGSYTLAFTALNNSYLQGAGARLSNQQVITITFTNASTTPIKCLVNLSFMPGIDQLQKYIDKSTTAVVGSMRLIKSAVPINIGIDCCIKADGGLTDAQIKERQQALASIIRQYPVGKKQLNFTELQQAFQTVYPDNKLSLPATIRAWIPTRDGDVYTATTQSGVFDISFRQGYYYWSSQTCFYTATYNNINFSVI